MRSKKIQQLIEQQTQTIQRTNPFFIRAERGKLTHYEVRLYLFNLKHVLQEATTNLKIASQATATLGWTELSSFIGSKVAEETGHDVWASNDLATFGEQNNSDLYLTEATRTIIHFARVTSLQAPLVYFCYMTFLEYFTVLSAPSLLYDLEHKCGITSSRMSVVANHQTADALHVTEDFLAFDRFLPTSVDENHLMASITLVSHLVSSGLASYSLENRTYHATADANTL